MSMSCKRSPKPKHLFHGVSGNYSPTCTCGWVSPATNVTQLDLAKAMWELHTHLVDYEFGNMEYNLG